MLQLKFTYVVRINQGVYQEQPAKQAEDFLHNSHHPRSPKTKFYANNSSMRLNISNT
jgi:hypothetical protein